MVLQCRGTPAARILKFASCTGAQVGTHIYDRSTMVFLTALAIDCLSILLCVGPGQGAFRDLGRRVCQIQGPSWANVC